MSEIEKNRIDKFRFLYKPNFFQIAKSWLNLNSFETIHVAIEQSESCSKAAFSNLTSLKNLEITSENDVTFESECFKGLQNLDQLEMHYENKKISNGLFHYLDSLTRLKLHLTRSVFFESDCFNGLEKLKELFIFADTYYTTNIDIEHFKNLSNLKKLVVYSNTFGPCEIEKFSNLEFVSFKSCVLNNLKCSKRIISLVSFDYSTDTHKILEIDKSFFMNVKNLVFLNLNCFILDNFDVTSLNVLENLEYLNINKCVDSTFSYEKLNLSKLKYLWIESATIPKFKYLNLEYLIIEKIKNIEEKNLVNQSNLIGLVLNKMSFETFSKLEKYHFSNLSKLIYFQFSFVDTPNDFYSDKYKEFLHKENVNCILLTKSYAVRFI